ncbi:hypothetical protein CEXT_217911 [Caerostris extrusa]|uniref:U4/U6.U5 small nuclear ribonucleoprotein 27kDa protein domain-containing protein n=1 Tax=Caerostris extrusa TaxID=172846 RepID=A0AAV4PY49_CAEEX|nr:hypothetical protein CEXT_217911 [Caerostris extrusa]
MASFVTISKATSSDGLCIIAVKAIVWPDRCDERYISQRSGRKNRRRKDMMKLMGFGNFDSTKGKHVAETLHMGACHSDENTATHDLEVENFALMHTLVGCGI